MPYFQLQFGVGPDLIQYPGRQPEHDLYLKYLHFEKTRLGILKHKDKKLWQVCRLKPKKKSLLIDFNAIKI